MREEPRAFCAVGYSTPSYTATLTPSSYDPITMVDYILESRHLTKEF